MKFTKAIREQIALDYASRNGGVFDPAGFASEVQARGDQHPAWEFFTKGTEAAAMKCWIGEARDFVRDLRINVVVQEPVERTAQVRVEYPAFFSPLANRSNKGGYRRTDPDNIDHIRELAAQAAKDLESWMNRYRAVIDRCGIDARSIEMVIGKLEATMPEAAE